MFAGVWHRYNSNEACRRSRVLTAAKGWWIRVRRLAGRSLHRLVLVVVGAVALVVAFVPSALGTSGSIAAAASTSSVTSPSVSLSSTAAGATDVDYTVGFTTSATTGAIPAGGTISLVAPQGTAWPGGGNFGVNYVITDSTTSSGSGNGGSFIMADNSAAVTMSVPNAIKAGDSLSIAVSGVVNPAAGSGSITISTSSDLTPVASPSYSITSTSSVTSPSVSLSSTAAGATDVDYTVGFTTSATTGAIPAGGTISLVAPQGTSWPGGGNFGVNYVITDSTTSSGSGNGGSFIMADNGAAVTMSVPNAIKAGDSLSIAVSGVVNPAAGSGSITISTSSDLTPVASPSYSITSTSSVTSPSVSLSSTAAGATDVDYTVGFTTSATTGAIPAGGTISLVAPQGTSWPGGNDYAITDSTTSSGSGNGGSITIADNGAAVTMSVPSAIKAGDSLSIAVSGVLNPGAGSGYSVSISTSTDLTPVGTPSYTITGSPSAQTSVSSVSFTPSSTAARATGVTYTVSFTASSSGGLSSGDYITLVAPAGTLFPGSCGSFCDFHVVDNTTSTSSSQNNATVDQGSVASFEAGQTINAGDSVTLTVNGVTNPPKTGSLDLKVQTSSDTDAVQAVDSVAADQAVASVSFTPSSTAARATGVSYRVSFTASSTGGLSSSGTSGGYITLVAPPGTLFPGTCGSFCDFKVVDNTTSTTTSQSNTTLDQGSVASFEVDQTINPGDSVTLTVTGVTNPPRSSGNVAIITSSDPAPVSEGDTIHAAKSVSSPSLSLSSTVAGATGVTYRVSFTASSTGGLSSSGTSGGYITLVAPPGTLFPGTCGSFCDFKVVDNTTSTTTSQSNTTLDQGSVASFEVDQTINPGDSVTLTVTGVTNSSTKGQEDLDASTSSDTSASSLSLTLAAGGPVSGDVTYDGNAVSGAPVQICPTVGGSCSTSNTSSNGDYTVEVPDGEYSATAYPTTSLNAAPASVGDIDVTGKSGVSGIDVALLPPPNLPSGVTIVSPAFGEETSSTPNPTVNWEQPFQVQIASSAFPTTNTVITELDVEGTSTVTGLPTVVTVAPGGTAGGVSIPVPAGTTITIPSLAPIHGPIAILAHYLSYGPGVTPKQGIAYPGELHFGTGSGSDQLLQITNVSNPNGINVSVSDITGPNAADFSIVTPKTEDTDYIDCEGASLLEANDGTGPENTSCVSQIHWTPDGHDAVEYATAIVDPPGQAPVGVSLIGCNSALTNQCATLLGYGAASAGGGGGAADMDDDFPDNNGGDVMGGGEDGGNPYVDPSGEVETTTSQGTVPLPGATVTLEEGPGTNGPFTAVPNGSDVMSPANRTNPDTTAADGSFGWDTVAGTYDVTASDSGCTSGELAEPVTVPPPATDLTISLSCSSAPSQASSHTTLATSSNPVDLGAPLTLTAAVSGSNPTGTVTFLDGSSQLATVPLSTAGSATLTTSALPSGSDSLTASYSGDGYNQSSVSGAVSQTVTPPTAPSTPEILTTSLERASINKTYSASVVGWGGTTPYQWSVTSGHLPAGLTLHASTGVIKGTPTALGTSSFTLKLTDSTSPTPQTATATLSVDVVQPVVLKIKPKTLPAGTTGTSYSVNVKARHGTGPYMFAVTSGTLPPGVTLSSSGLLSGLPTTSGTYSFTVGATDALGNTGVRYYTVTIT